MTSRSRAEEESRALAERWPISVIIPAHNAAAFLPATLAALDRNDLRNTEVLLVDDASTDQTGELARSLGFSIFRRERQQGPSAARNSGLRETSCPHVLFLDADVVVPPRTLGWIRETLELYSHRPDVAGVLGQYGESLPWSDFFTDFKNLSTCYLYRMTRTQSPFLHTAVFCVRRSVLEEVGEFDVQLTRGEDFRLGLTLGSLGYRFIIDRRIQATHLKRYSFSGILREDWHRVLQLASVKLPPEEKAFSLRAHRWNRLASVALPGLILAFAVMGFWNRAWVAAAGVLLLAFLLFNLHFLAYCRRLRGAWFALKAAGFLWVEMLWAQIALVASSVIRFWLRVARLGPSRG
jgi:glycosyltransferase involved in cell wall biosynthesis